MRRNFFSNRPWRRKVADPSFVGPQTVLRELQRRELSDLETCRHVWEQGADPLALCAAVTHAKLPEWLTSALLVMLTDRAGGWPSMPVKKWWRQRTQRAIDGVRAAHVAACRIHPEGPQTWESSFLLANELARKDHKAIPSVARFDNPPKISGIKRSYQKVQRGLVDPCRFYHAPNGTNERILLAQVYTLGVMRSSLKATQVGTAKAKRSTQTSDL